MAAHDPRDSREIPGLPFQGDQAFMLPPIRRARMPERDKRTYRACLHCRQRKSRCDLYVSPFLLLSNFSHELSEGISRFKPQSCLIHDPHIEFKSDLSIDMAVANQENHPVSDVFEKTMNVFSGHLIVVAEESNAILQSRSNRRMRFLKLLPRVKTPDSPLFLLCNKIVLVRKGTKTITDAYHLGHNTHQDRGVHRHQFQMHQPLTLAQR
jgi:hypothetical protein